MADIKRLESQLKVALKERKKQLKQETKEKTKTEEQMLKDIPRLLKKYGPMIRKIKKLAPMFYECMKEYHISFYDLKEVKFFRRLSFCCANDKLNVWKDCLYYPIPKNYTCTGDNVAIIAITFDGKLHSGSLRECTDSVNVDTTEIIDIKGFIKRTDEWRCWNSNTYTVQHFYDAVKKIPEAINYFIEYLDSDEWNLQLKQSETE